MSEITQEMWDELNEKYEQLRLNEEMYRVAVGMTDHTISVVDIATHTLNQIYNEGNWTGVSVSMPDVPESVLSTGIIHPDDCDGYREFYKNIYSGVPKGEYTMRVMEEERGWVWFTMYYQTIFNDDGTPNRAICFSDDVTRKKIAEEHYNNFRDAVTAEAQFVWEANLTKNIVTKKESKFDEFNATADDLESYDKLSELATNRITDEFQRNVVGEMFSREALIKAFDSAKQEVAYEYRFDYGELGIRWFRSVAYLITDDSGDIYTILCTNDITASMERLENLEHKAELDSLTGVYNRASFESKSEELLAKEPDKTHGLIMIDVDDFKQFNDNYGHAFGDGVLQLVSGVLKDTFRSGDIIGRVGGDEFVVFMNGAGSVDVVAERAKTVRRSLLDACRKQDLLMTITLSMGVAGSEPGLDLRTMYLRADEAMYKSKKAGKDCVHIYGH